jgi:ribosome-associated protein
VELRYDVENSDFPDEWKLRLKTVAGRQLTQDGVLIVTSQEHRTQERNRATALDKLVALLRKASIRPVRRIATKPTKASKTRRLDSKSIRSKTKAMRSTKKDLD